MEPRIALLLWIIGGCVGQKQEEVNINQRVGCFKDEADRRDLPHRITSTAALGSVENCVNACAAEYFMYAGIQDSGKACFCGSGYGRYGVGVCRSPCGEDSEELCGGNMTSSVYQTNINVAGPPHNLRMTSTTTTTLGISWSPPETTPPRLVRGYHVTVAMNKSFDSNDRRFTTKHLQTSGGEGTIVVGLQPGALYNVTVTTVSPEEREGPPTSKMFWTEVGTPLPPLKPKVRVTDDGGRMYVRFEPLKGNPNGPVTGYRIVVINGTEPVPLDPGSLYGYRRARREGIDYWIAAQIEIDYFEDHDEFLVGDGRRYGEYLNYGPLRLDAGDDYHVTVGTVSTLNNVTKVSYARAVRGVGEAGHFAGGVFTFGSGAGSDSEKRLEGGGGGNRYRYEVFKFDQDEYEGGGEGGGGGGSGLTIGLAVSIAVFGTILVIVAVAFFGMRFYMRKLRQRRRDGSYGDRQELRMQTPTFELTQPSSNGNGMTEGASSETDPLAGIRRTVWQIPRNFLDLSHVVIGRGKFGSVIKGKVNNRGAEDAAIVQVVPGKIMDEREMREMAREVDAVARCDDHPNVLGLIGVCEERDALFVVLREGDTTLKQTLLDSRALTHFPAYAQKNQRVTTLQEETVADAMVGVARGMRRLEELGILHRKLCARNVFLCGTDGRAVKVGGFGIADFAAPNEEVDVTRWTAQESLRSQSQLHYASKCDVWSFGCTMWEIATLGGTPYSEVRGSKELSARVMRGLRLPQPPNVSDDLYQLMLNCWQIDLDERPNFDEILQVLHDMDGASQLNYILTAGHEYAHFSNDLELIDAS